MTIPTFLPYYVLLGTAGIIAALLIGLDRALARAHWPVKQRKSIVGIAALILVLWLAAAAALGALGTFQAAADILPTIQYGVFLPIVVGVLFIWRSETVKRLIDAVPQAWIVGVQFYRALGVIFLILYAGAALPGLFAWPAGIGDILIGVLAPVVAIAYARNPSENGDLVATWNWFGIFDLIIAVAAGFITSPSLVQPFEVNPPNDLITLFPLVLIPTFLVPVSILLHVASLMKLHRRACGTESRSELSASSA